MDNCQILVDTEHNTILLSFWYLNLEENLVPCWCVLAHQNLRWMSCWFFLGNEDRWWKIKCLLSVRSLFSKGKELRKGYEKSNPLCPRMRIMRSLGLFTFDNWDLRGWRGWILEPPTMSTLRFFSWCQVLDHTHLWIEGWRSLGRLINCYCDQWMK